MKNSRKDHEKSRPSRRSPEFAERCVSDVVYRPQVSIPLFSVSLEIKEHFQLLNSVVGARNGVASDSRVMKELVVVASRVGSVAEEVDSLEVFLLGGELEVKQVSIASREGTREASERRAVTSVSGKVSERPTFSMRRSTKVLSHPIGLQEWTR